MIQGIVPSDQRVLYLSICKILIGGEVSTNFKLRSYLKIKEQIFEKNQGWKVAKAITFKLEKWMGFM